MSTLRTRWAAVGAAVAVTLGGGSLGLVSATGDSGDGPVAAFFPIEPCRLADTRPDVIGADSSRSFDGWGTTGDCTLPTGTAGLAVNVTAVDATEQTNIRLFPEAAPVPETANLNPTPGAAPTPNAVDVTLNGTNGKFEVYNRFGTVAIVIDVMGYYDDHTHDDRYDTESEAAARVADAIAASSAGHVLARGIVSSLDPENPLELVTVRGIEVAVASVALGRYTVEVKGADLDLAPIVMVVAQTPAAGSIECHTRSLTTVGGYTATVQCTDDGIATDTSFQFVVVGDVATD